MKGERDVFRGKDEEKGLEEGLEEEEGKEGIRGAEQENPLRFSK